MAVGQDGLAAVGRGVGIQGIEDLPVAVGALFHHLSPVAPDIFRDLRLHAIVAEGVHVVVVGVGRNETDSGIHHLKAPQQGAVLFLGKYPGKDHPYLADPGDLPVLSADKKAQVRLPQVFSGSL